MAAIAPFAIKAGVAIASHYMGKKLSGPSKEQKAGLQGGQQATDALAAYSRPLMSQGLGMAQQGGQNLGQATDYYSGVLGGDRSKILAHMSPEISGVLDSYRGAEGKIGRNLRGGSRDYAQAELDRQKVGQVAGLIPQARRNAAEAMGDLGGQYLAGGTSLTGQGVAAAGGAANASSQLYGNATAQSQQEAQGGKVMGGYIYDILNSKFPKLMGGQQKPLAGTIYGSLPNMPQNKPAAKIPPSPGTAPLLPSYQTPSY